MPPRIIPKYKNEQKKVGELRKSQLITTYGCGALVDFPRMSGIMAGIDDWDVTQLPASAKIHERNLERLLNKKYFEQPTPDNHYGKRFSLPIYRFPNVYFCPSCHILDKYWKIRKSSNNNTSEYNSDLYCGFCLQKKNKKIKLVPSRFVVACRNGHIDDFPYNWWVHRNHGECDNPQLFLEYKGNTGNLSSIHIKCKNCGAEETMAHCMDSNALLGLRCYGTSPWLGRDPQRKWGWYEDSVNCSEPLRVLLRNANNVYYPINKSAITIPPWSSRIHRILREHNDTLEEIFDGEPEDIEHDLKRHYKHNKDEYNCTYEIFRKEAFRAFGGNGGQEIVTDDTIKVDEYYALSNEDRDEEFFKTITTTIKGELKDYIDEVKIVSRLRQVKTLLGFKRIEPQNVTISEDDNNARNEETSNLKEYAPLSREEKEWLPAIEMYGEGIFIKLNEQRVCEWENNNKERYLKLIERWMHAQWIGNNMFGPDNIRYVLLHTFSHLLIRQLTLQCGYVSASLNEKIYSTLNGFSVPMAGILIYTAATDSDGSLGGLAREGYGPRLSTTILSMLEESSWCSNDPICIESKSQGYRGLNYAACHACTLLPETSCESMNCLLDRAAIVGTPEDPECGYFSGLL